MKRLLKYIVSLFFLVISSVTYSQHQLIYGHYLVDPIVLNPAFTGYDKVPVASLSYRNQWTGLEGAPSSQMLTWHARLRDNKNALGLTALRDIIGVSSSVNIRFNYAHEYKLSRKWFLSLGANGGATFAKNNWDNIITVDDQDKSFQGTTSSGIAPNFAFGANIYREDLFISLSIPSFLSYQSIGNKVRPNYNIRNYNYWLAAGYTLHLNEELDLGLGGVLKYLADSPFQGDLTTFISFKKAIKAGLSWRSGDALSALVGYQVSKQFGFGYQYDFTLSAINTVSRGSHELNIRYLFKYEVNTVNPKFF